MREGTPVANIVVVSDRYPANLANGRYLRQFHLCRELSRRNDCYLVDFEGLGADADRGIFQDRMSLPPPPPKQSRAIRRLFRLSNARVLELGCPGWYAESVDALRNLVGQWKADAILAFSQPLPELVLPIDRPKVMDWSDSATLTFRRARAAREALPTMMERVSHAISARRARGQEMALVAGFDFTTTIGEPDREVLVEVSRVGPARVRVIPNGVSEDALSVHRGSPVPNRSVVFWGNLKFPPNASAVRWFYRKVFAPFLKDAGVRFEVVGGNVPPDIADLARDPWVTVHGFRDDLFPFAAEQGLMVNPMVQGSGLKNKVLEAFAIGIPVVTTSMGVDALPVAHGVHCRIADDPGSFAESVVRLLEDSGEAGRVSAKARELVETSFTWERVGDELNRLFRNDVLGMRAPLD